MGFSVLTFSACASLETQNASDKTQLNSPTDGLAAQELEIGECGMFFWTDTHPRTFILFQKQGSAEAKYYAGTTEINLTTNQNTNNMDDIAVFDISYNHPDYTVFNIKGSFSDILEGGRRITNARIKTKKAETWEEIQPVTGIYGCR